MRSDWRSGSLADYQPVGPGSFRQRPLEPHRRFGYSPRHVYKAPETPAASLLGLVMKVRNSLKSLRNRHRDNRLVRRKGRVYIINKTQKRYKARQG